MIFFFFQPFHELYKAKIFTATQGICYWLKLNFNVFDSLWVMVTVVLHNEFQENEQTAG